MASEATARDFFSAPYFAVVGASNDTNKFGHKIFTWYTQYNLPATPIHPSAPAITTNGVDYPTLPNLSALPHPKETSVSFITPPKVTAKLLEEAKGLGIKGVWLQPGTFDDAVLQYAFREFEAPVGGEGGRGSEGWCVLVDGARAGKAAGLKL